MSSRARDLAKATLIWCVVAAVIAIPFAAAAQSPLLAWRDPIYIASGFAGIVGMALLLLQPLLASGAFPGVPLARSRQIHRLTGVLLVLAVIGHVVGLWITSPPDVIDALLFVSPTPFAAWGVIAMWAIFATAALAALRHWFKARLRLWRVGHTLLALTIVVGTIVHAVLIQGTMEMTSKIVLSACIVAAMVKALYDQRLWVLFLRTKPRPQT